MFFAAVARTPSAVEFPLPAGARSIAGMRRTTFLLTVLSLFPAVARATPAPDSVAIVANADVPGSVALAMRYAEARSVPASQICLLPLPTTADMAFDDLGPMLLEPLDDCLGEHRSRIESVVLMRGVPIRVRTPMGAQVSVAAALGLWDSTLTDGTPVLGSDPGLVVDCGGSPCTRARLSNLYTAGPFEAGWSATGPVYTHRPVLVTMLHGRTDADAEGLIDVALRAEEGGEETGTFMLMNGADAARGVLDMFYPQVVTALTAREVTSEIVPFDRDLTGRVLAGFATGTSSLDTTIEGNTYVRGALVDNLTSFGAVPQNFEETGQSQVSIARWVTAGAAGAHGTVAEPLNNCFPARTFLSDYAAGATLAEAYLGRMPFVYWMNLVLGDPMLAPYAERPTVTIDGLEGGSAFDEALIVARVTPPIGRSVASLILYVDGVEVGRSEGEPIEHCLAPSAAGNVTVLAVARTTADEDALRLYPAAGWADVSASASGTGGSCAPDAGVGDGGASDAGVGAEVEMPMSSGCSCRAGQRSGGSMAWLALAGLAMFLRRRGR
jgi:uncharacterized protein (TIGR03790 family)